MNLNNFYKDLEMEDNSLQTFDDEFFIPVLANPWYPKEPEDKNKIKASKDVNYGINSKV